MNTTTLNMTTLDGGVIIKKGGGSTPTPPSGGDEWVYYKFDGEAVENTEGYDVGEFYTMIGSFFAYFYMSSAYKLVDRVEEKITLSAMHWDENPVSSHLGFKAQTSVNLMKGMGLPVTEVMTLKELFDYLVEMSGGQISPLFAAFANALTPCTKEEFEALITL